MASKDLFSSSRGEMADTKNRAGGVAFKMSDKHELAQYALTGTFNTTYYARPLKSELDRVLELVKRVGKEDPEFIAKLAVYARQEGLMKDTPAFMVAFLATIDTKLMERVFPKVINNGKMLRNFVQMIRSGQLGRKSLGSAPKRAVLNWLESRSDDQIFFSTIGNDPSLADVIKMVHPKPKTKSRAALYGYILGKEHDAEALPETVKKFEAFKKDNSGEQPSVPWEFLTGLPLETKHWKAIARDMRFLGTIKNLNTLERHGVFKDQEFVDLVAKRVKDVSQIQRANVLPYQVMAAYLNSKGSVPNKIVDALHDAMEAAISNVPELQGETLIAIDTSGSMHSPATGYRGSATSKMTCRDIAALFGASVLRKNPSAKLITVSSNVVQPKVSGRDTVLTTANALNKAGGGTALGLIGEFANKSQTVYDNIIVVSDNESWMSDYSWGGPPLSQEFAKFRSKRNPNAKIVCIDIAANETTQVKNKPGQLNVGGFNDTVFNVVSQFINGSNTGEEFVTTVESVSLD